MKTSPVTNVSVLLLIVLLWHSALLAEDISLSKQGGVYELPVEVNGVIILYFILDTGASEVNIPADVALTLYRTGTIQDFLPGQIYALADGSTLKSSRFMLQSLKIGNHRITNVPASVGAVSSPLLLGQSFLERLGTWGMDSQKQVLIIGASTQRESPAPRPDIPPSSTEVPQQSSSTYPSQPQVARLEPEHKLRERESVAVPASTVSGESRGVQIWSRKMPAFHMDLKPVSNREFLDFVKADP
jgi:clan AA aspartic protease (TIGR02281 family)